MFLEGAREEQRLGEHEKFVQQSGGQTLREWAQGQRERQVMFVAPLTESRPIRLRGGMQEQANFPMQRGGALAPIRQLPAVAQPVRARARAPVRTQAVARQRVAVPFKVDAIKAQRDMAQARWGWWGPREGRMDLMTGPSARTQPWFRPSQGRMELVTAGKKKKRKKKGKKKDKKKKKTRSKKTIEVLKSK